MRLEFGSSSFVRITAGLAPIVCAQDTCLIKSGSWSKWNRRPCVMGVQVKEAITLGSNKVI